MTISTSTQCRDGLRHDNKVETMHEDGVPCDFLICKKCGYLQ